jgi:prephenate dehydratase
MKYAYLGPDGTFTETALRNALSHSPHLPQAVCVPFATVPAALESVRRGECFAAMVPMENSLKGVVPATLEGFAAAAVAEDLHIVGETELKVTFALMAAPGAVLAGLRRIRSHPHALAQCAAWLERLPRAALETAGSTAAAARDVLAAGTLTDAAIASPAVAERYGLRVLATDIGERENAVTRFVLVRRAGVPPARTGRDRTSLLVSVGDRTPAALPDVLSVFSAGRVNLTWVQAWPTGARLGNYRFFVDVEGHIDDQPVSHALAALSDIGAEASFLGSYPRDGDRPQPAPVAV